MRLGAPAYAARGVSSTSVITSIVRSLGAPVMEPAGNSARSAPTTDNLTAGGPFLDVDALRIVSKGVNALRRPESATLLVTHYQRLLDYIVPDQVHVLAGGKIVKSGGKELAHELESRGYEWLAG